jgi:hypothetical protein
MEQPPFVEQIEPEEVFTLVSDENRISILRALWDSDEPLAFSELQDAVDIRDSGQFNYHLDKLVGQFITKAEEGYALTAAGDQINGAIEAGSYTTSGTMDPISLDEPCPACGGSRTFHYEDEKAHTTCDSCSFQAAFAVPPSAFVDCERSEIPDAAAQYLRTILERLDSGFCSQCDGPIERHVGRLSDSSVSDDSEVEEDLLDGAQKLPVVEYECLQCGMEPTSGLTYSLLTHPAVVSFYHDHGIDIRNRPLWEFSTFETDTEQIQTADPFRASTTFIAGDEQLTVVVDADLTVVETTVSAAD